MKVMPSPHYQTVGTSFWYPPKMKPTPGCDATKVDFVAMTTLEPTSYPVCLI
jgi:hypothetical protein